MTIVLFMVVALAFVVWRCLRPRNPKLTGGNHWQNPPTDEQTIHPLTSAELEAIRQWAPGQITAEGRRMMQAGLPVLTEEAMTEHHRQLK